MSDHRSDTFAQTGRPVARDAMLAETFVALADTLVEDFDLIDLLHRLVQAAVELLPATAAGLLLLDPQNRLRAVSTSSDQVELLEAFQLQSDEGPCLDCVRTGAPVVVEDLSTGGARWPRFTSVALAAGFGSVHAVPLRLRSERIGGLNLFHTGTGAPPGFDVRVAQALADVATIGILQQRAIHRGTVVTEQLQTALNSRVVLEQAKGMLAEHGQVGMDIAFASLRRYARDHNLKLGDVALAVTDGVISLAQVLAAGQR